jgi:uridylate kinase
MEAITGMKAYERVLLKLSGEALAGAKKTGFDEATCIGVAKQVKELVEQGIQVSIVIGGGNFWRGRTSETIDRTKADQIGMLATVMNCIYVSEIFRYVGLTTEVFTPFACGSFTKLFAKDEVIRCMKQGGVAFLAGGTGHPYFSTDTATVLRAVELDCDIILNAKSIDGVYDSDPKLNPNAIKFDEIPLQKVLDQKLGVIDLSATVLCIENKMPMLLFGLSEEGSIVKAAQGISKGTRLTVE